MWITFWDNYTCLKKQLDFLNNSVEPSLLFFERKQTCKICTWIFFFLREISGGWFSWDQGLSGYVFRVRINPWNHLFTFYLTIFFFPHIVYIWLCWKKLFCTHTHSFRYQIMYVYAHYLYMRITTTTLLVSAWLNHGAKFKNNVHLFFCDDSSPNIMKGIINHSSFFDYIMHMCVYFLSSSQKGCLLND